MENESLYFRQIKFNNINNRAQSYQYKIPENYWFSDPNFFCYRGNILAGELEVLRTTNINIQIRLSIWTQDLSVTSRHVNRWTKALTVMLIAFIFAKIEQIS